MIRFRPQVAWSYLLELLPYLRVTLAYTVGALLIGLVFGALLAAAKMSRHKILRGFASSYTAILRSIPSIVLMFLVYYAVPALAKQWFGLTVNKENVLGFTILALGLLNIAVMSETLRSAYQSVPKGQYEGAVSNGISPAQAVIRIILPQALLIAIPNIGNSVVRLVKEGSLAYTIGLVDIMGRAYIADGKTLHNNMFEIYICLAAVYWLLSILIDWIFRLAERGLTVDRVTAKLRKEAA